VEQFGVITYCIRACFGLQCKLCHAAPTHMYLANIQRSSSRYGW